MRIIIKKKPSVIFFFEERNSQKCIRNCNIYLTRPSTYGFSHSTDFRLIHSNLPFEILVAFLISQNKQVCYLKKAIIVSYYNWKEKKKGTLGEKSVSRYSLDKLINVISVIVLSLQNSFFCLFPLLSGFCILVFLYFLQMGFSRHLFGFHVCSCLRLSGQFSSFRIKGWVTGLPLQLTTNLPSHQRNQKKSLEMLSLPSVEEGFCSLP